MAVVDSAKCAYRVPGQHNLRKRPRARFRFYSGFTLIELLVVIAIIAILASILFPVFTAARASSEKAKCLSNLKQLSSAWQIYADDNGGRACPSYYFSHDFSVMYSWDVITDTNADPPKISLGLLGRYTRTQQINACPLIKKGAWDRVYTGYAYNASYVGGDPSNTAPRLKVPCALSDIVSPGRTVLFADAAYGNPPLPHNYLRAPSDPLFPCGTVHFRHSGAACAAYADGHVAATKAKYRCDVNNAPECGALSEDDSAYDLR